MSRLTVAYDARFLQPKTRHWGVGVVIESIVGRLRGEFRMLGVAQKFDSPYPDMKTWPGIRVLKPVFFEMSTFWADPFDVYWGANHFLPAFLERPAVLTVHDMLFLNQIEGGRLGGFFCQRFKSSLHRATRIVTVSQTTADELITKFPELRTKVDVVLSGYADGGTNSDQAVSAAGFPDSPYALMLGCHRPRKNLGLAVATIMRLREEGVDIRLVVTGDVHPSFRNMLQRCPEGVEERGVLPNQALFSLLSRAACVFFPSRYEGFGFPLLEAMAAGCPVLALDIPINREIAGEAACLLPEDPIRWAAACRQILEAGDFRDEMKGRGFENLKRFSWDTTAAAYRQIFMEVAR